MKTVVIFCEGQTEVAFVKNVLYHEFWPKEVFMEARLIPTSSLGKGGSLNRQRIRHFLQKALRQQRNVYFTTFFDLYSLPKDLQGSENIPSKTDPIKRAKKAESALHEAVIHEIGCRHERFFPHVQPYEFEALLFSDTTGFAEADPLWKVLSEKLAIVREMSKSPEHINDGADTHPSAHLLNILNPPYKKVFHGVKVSSIIGIDRIREECKHFDSWLSHIENLSMLD